MSKFTAEEIKMLEQYVSDPTGDVFVVFPFLQGIVGAAFARYSRAKGGFREVLLKEFLKTGVLDHKHAQTLIERILVGFGDDSVGELEGSWLSLEEISNLATKEIEDNRIGGSPIEQSTRYVFYDQKDDKGCYRYLRVPEIMNSSLGLEFEQTMDFIFDTYCRLIEPMQSYFRQLKPITEASYDIRGDKQPVKLPDLIDAKEIKAFEITYAFDIRSKACDTLRILLPACTRTNVGIFGNGRFYQYALTKLYSHSLKEMNNLADKAHAALNTVIPVYVKRAKRSIYLEKTEHQLRELVEQLLVGHKPWPTDDVDLLNDLPVDLENDMLAVMMYKYAELPLRQLIKIVYYDMTPPQHQILFDTYLGQRQNRHDRPGRALEFGYPIVFDCVADFGIYRDLQRERMKTQIRQMLTTRLGYVVPDEFEAIGEKEALLQCYEKSKDLYEHIRSALGREVAQYVVLFGFNIRWYQGENYREALHELELRTGKQGHPNYRKICQKMFRLLESHNPFLAKIFQFVDLNDYYWSRAESEARQRAKERKLD